MAKVVKPPTEETDKKKKMNRREFLTFAWLASLGFLTINAAGITYLFAMPRFKAGEFGGIYPYGTVSDLPTITDPPQNYPKVKIWMSNSTEGTIALYKVCTRRIVLSVPVTARNFKKMVPILPDRLRGVSTGFQSRS